MRSLYFLAVLLGGNFFGSLLATSAWSMDASEEAILRDSAENDKEDEQEAYQRRFARQEQIRIEAEEKRRNAPPPPLKLQKGQKTPANVQAYLAAHENAKISLTPPPVLSKEGAVMPPVPALSPEAAQKISQNQLQAQLHQAQAAHRNSGSPAEGNPKNFTLGLDPAQKASSRYFPQSAYGDKPLNPAAAYGTGGQHWKSELPGMTVEELLGETHGSLIDALELCPPSAKAEASLKNCLKHHSPPQWWLADLKRSSPKLLIEKWKALKMIQPNKPEDPLSLYADWLSDMIPQEFEERHHPEFISALVRPQNKAASDPKYPPETGLKLPPPPQPVAPAPLNLAEAKAALVGGLPKPNTITDVNGVSPQQKQALAAGKTKEAYIGEDNAQYLYPMTTETPHLRPGELPPPRRGGRALAPPPPVAGVEAYRDE